MRKVHTRSLWPRTLRAQLILLLLVFWLVPIVGLGSYTYLIYRQSVVANLRNTMANRLHYAALLANEKVGGTITASRQISYDTTLEKINDDYVQVLGKINTSSSMGDDEAAIQGQMVYAAQTQLKDACTNYLNSQFSLNNDFQMALLVLDALPSYNNYVERTGQNQYSYYTTFVQSQAQEMSKTLGNKIGFIVSNQRLYLVRSLRRMNNTSSFGMLVLQLNTDSVFQFLLDTVQDNGPFFIQLNESPITLATPLYETIQPPILTKNDPTLVEQVGVVTFSGWFEGRDYSFGYQVPLSTAVLYGEFNGYSQILLLLAGVAIPFFWLIFRSFQNRFARPLESLSSAAWALRAGDLGVHAQAPRNDEIGELVQSFNAMSDQMQNLFNRVYREQLALKDARIIALQSQINPHFFNNTLELMNWKARMLGDEQLCDMIQALSTLLDSAMDRRNARFVPLKDEMAVADAYLTIISARFGKRMHLVKDVDESRLNSPVPRMILQPLLENAVVHGLEPAGGGTLTLRVVSERADMVVSIINDGIPLTEEDFNHIQDLLTKPVDSSDPRSHHIGIRNVHERLRLIYGEKSGLVFSLDENKRTHCLFRLPPPPPERE